jgi:hypothetical protein
MLWQRWKLLPWTILSREREKLREFLAVAPEVEGAIHSFPSPVSPQRTVVMLETPERGGGESIHRLLEGSLDVKNVYGSISLLTAEEAHSFHASTESSEAGDLSWLETFYFWSARFYWLLPIAIVLLLRTPASALEQWLLRRIAVRLGTPVESEH